MRSKIQLSDLLPEGKEGPVAQTTDILFAGTQTAMPTRDIPCVDPRGVKGEHTLSNKQTR